MATLVPELDPATEPEPATLAPEGTGNSPGQFGGNVPSRDSDTSPLGVEAWKFSAVLAEAGLAAEAAGLAVDELLLEQPAATARQAIRRPTASREFSIFLPSPGWVTGAEASCAAVTRREIRRRRPVQ